MSYKVLLVEDDATTADYIAKGLVEEGFTVDRADNGRDGLFLATEAAHDAIILDRMLPGMDGMAVLAALRAAGIDTPVIILSALATADERIKGLTGGSDDYLAKPFAFAELLARLRIILRRGGGQAPETRLSCGDLDVDLLSRKVKRGARVIDLQPREFRLLDYLLRHQGEVVTRTMLLEGVWDYHFDPGTNVIDVHISRLRRKVDEDGEPPLIHTIRGAGYRLSEQG
ncbi:MULTISPECIES: winged helix-turn-helix domain-containing protein [Sphingomonadaceae]|uniref:winged helix-turn-helix domain-containing protein n=1 Tax=Sphingomonadales TaxID=204457 RepID=UPI001CCC1539|nr:winged helix-turn-helix domain-containing protein [Sphingobium sp. 3R8]MBZ9649654.1 winged helix-turn-helix domain-containing protein [Sphingobium sp. 3R8]